MYCCSLQRTVSRQDWNCKNKMLKKRELVIHWPHLKHCPCLWQFLSFPKASANGMQQQNKPWPNCQDRAANLLSAHKGKHGNWKVLPLSLSALTAAALDLLYWNGSTKGRGKRLNRNYWRPNTILAVKYLINDSFLWWLKDLAPGVNASIQTGFHPPPCTYVHTPPHLGQLPLL